MQFCQAPFYPSIFALISFSKKSPVVSGDTEYDWSFTITLTPVLHLPMQNVPASSIFFEIVLFDKLLKLLYYLTRTFEMAGAADADRDFHDLPPSLFKLWRSHPAEMAGEFYSYSTTLAQRSNSSRSSGRPLTDCEAATIGSHFCT